MTSPTEREGPATDATTGSGQVFCDDTTKPSGAEVSDGELGGPRRVVGLHGHEGDLEVARQPGRLVQMHRGRPGLEGIVRSR